MKKVNYLVNKEKRVKPTGRVPANLLSLEEMRQEVLFDSKNLGPYYSLETLVDKIEATTWDHRDSIEIVVEEYSQIVSRIKSNKYKVIAAFQFAKTFANKHIGVISDKIHEIDVKTEEGLKDINYRLKVLRQIVFIGIKARDSIEDEPTSHELAFLFSELIPVYVLPYFKLQNDLQWPFSTSDEVYGYYQKTNHSYSLDIDFQIIANLTRMQQLDQAYEFIKRAHKKIHLAFEQNPQGVETNANCLYLRRMLVKKYRSTDYDNPDSAPLVKDSIEGFNVDIYNDIIDMCGGIEMQGSEPESGQIGVN